MRAIKRVGAFAAVMLGLFALPATAWEKTGKPFLVVSTVTYHTRDNDEMNNTNPGAGLGIALTPTFGIVAGSFRNSYSQQSRYAMMRLRLMERLPVHLCTGYLDGYAKFSGTTAPVGGALDFELGPVVLLAMPGKHGGAALSLWLRFNP